MTRAFTVAWFFHCPPPTVLALPLPIFLVWERQMLGIVERCRALRATRDGF